MIRRIMQVEITTQDEDPSRLARGECHVKIINPRSGKVVADLHWEPADLWLAEE